MQFTKFLPNQGGRTKVLSGFVQRRSTMLFLMRVSVFYVALISGSIQLSLASSSIGQKLDETYVTVELNHESLQALFEKIEKQTNLLFTFPEGVKSYNALTLVSGRRSVKETLDMVLKDTPVTYKQINGNLVAVFVGGRDRSESTELKDIENNKSTITLALINGTVNDALTKEPLAGVNVIVKGTTKGTVTDSEGKFSIDANQNDILAFSFIGYKTYEVQIAEHAIVNVALEEDVASLQEVVINGGYYQVTKEKQTGNIAKVTSDVIEKQPVSNPLAALQASVPGLEITQQNGVPGGSFNVRIRGQNSIANGNDPLYIIDGVPFTSTTMSFAEASGEILPQDALGTGGASPLNYINPMDIESIEVLKDAAATSIYGSRAANGVILITTKKGKIGATKVDVNFYTGTSKVPTRLNMLNSGQYLEMRLEGVENDGLSPLLEDPAYAPYFPDIKLWDVNRYTNWQKELIGGSAQTTDAQLSISGGDRITQFSFGGGYHKETTVFPGNNSDQRISTHLNISNTSLNGKFKSMLSLNYTSLNSALLTRDLTLLALTLPPDAPALYDEHGDLNWENDTWENPLRYTVRQNDANTTNLISNIVLSYEIVPGLELKSSLGYTNTVMKSIATTPNRFYGPALRAVTPHASTFANSNFRNWIVEPQINWIKKIGTSNLNLLIGTSFLEQVKEGAVLIGSGFANESLMKNIGAATDRSSGTNYYSQYRYHAFFSRINYTLRDRYIIDLTGRRDGSSRFGPGKQFANFGAVGIAWIFSEEELIKRSLPFLSFGKIRSSYGITGNDQIGDYGFLDTYTSTPSYMGTPGLRPARLYNDKFAWETNKKLEIGLEFGFVKKRILSSVSYYHNRSSNQLIGFSLPPTTGFSSILSNFPATVQNTGIEVQVDSRNLENSNFVWTTSFNLSIPRNKLVRFKDLETSTEYASKLVVGESLNIQKLYHYLGVDSQSGIYQFEDVNEDNSLDQNDRQVVKFIGRDFYGGLNNSFQYKGFQLDVLLQFVKQTGFDFWMSTPGSQSNQPAAVMNRWQQSGDNSDIQQFTAGYGPAATPYSYYMSSDKFIVGASFIRLKNVSFSYSFNSLLTSKLHLSNMRLFVQGQNLLVFTGYRGLNVENPGSTSLPPLRTITAGIHLTF